MSIKYGLIAGSLMSALLLIFQLSGNDFSPFLKLLKYTPLAIVIIIGLNAYKSKINGDIFINGISFGAKLSLLAGLVLVIANILLYVIYPEIAFSKYGLEPHALSSVLVISAILFFETFVFGNIISFCILQYLKGDRVQK